MTLDVKASSTRVRLLACSYALALFPLTVLASFSGPGLLALLVLSAGLTHWAWQWRRPHVIRRVRVSENAEWKIWTEREGELAASLLPGSIVVSWCLLLQFRDQGGRFRAVLLFHDSLEADGFRRLTVRLKTLPLPAPSSRP